MEPLSFAILDHLTDAVCVLDLEQRLVFANRVMLALGGGQEEMVGEKCRELCRQSPCCQHLQPAGQSVVDQVLATGRETKNILHYPMSDSTGRYFEATASPVRDAGGDMVNILLTLHDVTESELDKQRLARAATVDAGVAELAKSLIAGRTMEEIADLVRDKARLLTSSRQALVGTMAAGGGLVVPSLLQQGQPLLSNDPASDSRNIGCLTEHIPVHRFLSAPAMVGDRILGQVAVANAERDYTPEDQIVLERLAGLFALAVQHRDHDQNILRVKQEWERTFDAIGDIVCLQDREMRIVRVNQATALLFGQEPDELIGQPCYSLFHDSDKPCAGCPIDTVLATSKSHFAVVEHPKFDKIFEVTLSPIINDLGETTGYAHFAKDITGLRRLELQLREALKMEAVGRLAGGVAHDFNNVLTVISGYLGLALADAEPGSSVTAALTEMEKAARRAAGLVRQLLLFSRRQPMEFTAIDFNGALNELLKMLRRFIGENILIEMTFADDLWPLAGDAGSVDQIVMNLAVNARDAMPDGGTLTIETKNVEVDAAFCSGKLNARPGRFVRLSVSDTGCGMDQETIQHIFEPFFTTKEAGKGTGLGLAVVYGIVSEHRGWISCFSEPGMGTVFHAYLPVADSAMQAAQPPAGHDLRGIQGHGARVLLVEDEESLLEFGGWALSSNGYQVVKAHSVAEAMEVVSREGAEFDLLFTDVVLPDGYGTDLAARVSVLWPGIAVILTSGYPDKQGQWPRIREQKWTFLQKPYEVPELLIAMQKGVAARTC